MIPDGNGRFGPPGDGDDSQEPDDVFPFREEFSDDSGGRRSFDISMVDVPTGYLVNATEQGTDDKEGYFFREFDPNSPYLALGRLRGRSRRALATRHLEERAPGDYSPLHDTLRGRISCSSEEGEVAFVIDGRPLTLAQFARIVQAYEGWEFRLDFLDNGDDGR